MQMPLTLELDSSIGDDNILASLDHRKVIVRIMHSGANAYIAINSYAAIGSLRIYGTPVKSMCANIWRIHIAKDDITHGGTDGGVLEKGGRIAKIKHVGIGVQSFIRG